MIRYDILIGCIQTKHEEIHVEETPQSINNFESMARIAYRS